MKCRGRWAVVWLLCVCGVFGCAQLPTRGLFTRRPTLPATDLPDETARDDESFALSNEPDDPSRNSQSEDSSAGMLDESNGGASSGRFAAVEAPSPKRRSGTSPVVAETRPPNVFAPPDDIRELRPTASQNPIELVGGIAPSGNLDAGSGVMTADYSQSTSGGYSTDVELAAGKRRVSNTANGAVNPWDRFRGLTNNLDPNAIRPDQPLATERPNVSTPPAVNQFPLQPQAFTPTTANDAAVNDTNAPALWPRSPGLADPNSAAPQNVQWVNSEQPANNNGTVARLPFPSQLNPPGFDPTANGSLNWGRPEGSPVAIVPFASSQDLERLITQTTVEAAALIPGDNEVARQIYLRKHVQLRLLHLIAGQMDRALQPIPGVDSTDQEFWQQMMWGMANYFDTQGMPDSSERATQTIAQLKSATARLQEKARLELRNVAFCYKISGFGNYQRFKRDEFTPGQPVLLYSEIGNFKSELVSEGQFRTLLKSTLEFVEGGPTGRVVETLPLAPSEDRCRNQRRDYYHSYEFTIPQACNPGPHTLRLRVEDQLGKKLAVTTLNFTVQ